MSTPPDHHEAADELRTIPGVDTVLRQPAVERLLAEHPRSEVLHAVRTVLRKVRRELRSGQPASVETPELAIAVRQTLRDRAMPHLRRVVNATGIVLHTNLGRAPLPDVAVAAMTEVAGAYSNLEYNLQTGERGSRYDHVRELLAELTGATDALVVNNNAGATLLTLHTLAAECEVVVSRGQLVEIGGSYRMPDVMAAARCRLREVGTTNRTHDEDYENAIGPETAALLHVHTSNYRVCGFTYAVSIRRLAEIAHARGLLAIDDLGSGLLDRDFAWPAPPARSVPTPAEPPEEEEEADLPMTSTPNGATGPPPLPDWDEPSVRESISAGADVTLFSGDKLLGGPQAGIIVGRSELIARLRRNPLTRALRPDKLTLAALEATLKLYRDPQQLIQQHPVWRMLSASRATLAPVAIRLEHSLRRNLPAASVETRPDVSEAGGGALPTVEFPTWTVRFQHPTCRAHALATLLRGRQTPVICRVQDDALVFDCRTLLAGDVEEITSALAEALRELVE